MDNIFKVFFGILLGSLITTFLYESYLKPKAINLAIENYSLTAQNKELERKAKQASLELEEQLKKLSSSELKSSDIPSG